jgi:hypothetical protein
MDQYFFWKINDENSFETKKIVVLLFKKKQKPP